MRVEQVEVCEGATGQEVRGRVRPMLAHAVFEIRLTVRQGEQLLVSLVIPLAMFVFLSRVRVGGVGGPGSVDELVPRILALAVMSNAFTSLSIATGFERSHLVLKRLGASPLGRARLVGAKATAVLAVEAFQVAVLLLTAVALGWHAKWNLFLVPVLALGTYVFAALGLVFAGALPALVNLAATNAVYVLLVLFGGTVVPASELHEPLSSLAALLPPDALGRLLEETVGTQSLGSSVAEWIVLGAWATLATTIAAATFRWE